MRRSGGNTSAATTASGGSGNLAEPNGAPDASKPEPAALPIPTDRPAPGLHLVATPIGNLSDISLRALAVLRGADRIYCEDTRVTGKLLARFGIKAGLDVYHDHNAEAVRPRDPFGIEGWGALGLGQ